MSKDRITCPRCGKEGVSIYGLANHFINDCHPESPPAFQGWSQSKTTEIIPPPPSSDGYWSAVSSSIEACSRMVEGGMYENIDDWEDRLANLIKLVEEGAPKE